MATAKARMHAEEMASKKFVSSGQNPSGHINMDSQQQRFFQEIMNKDHKVSKLREWGMLSYKPSRNPLKAERSPRNEFIGFNFDPPPAKPEPPRWNYPETDWGLMAKFKSQKPTFEKIFEREQNEPKVLAALKAIGDQNMDIVQQEIDRQQAIIEKDRLESKAEEKRIRQLEEMMENPQRYAEKHYHRHSHHGGGAVQSSSEATLLLLAEEEADRNKQTGRGTGRGGGAGQGDQHHPHVPLTHFLDPHHNSVDHSSLLAVAKSTQHNLSLIKQEWQAKAQSKQGLTAFPATSITLLKDDHPDLMKQYRTERAKSYIARQGIAAMKPPLHTEGPIDGAVAFRPGGISKPNLKEFAYINKHQYESKVRVKDPNQALVHGTVLDNTLPMVVLQEQLAKTEYEIERQKLKIGLKKKSNHA